MRSIYIWNRPDPSPFHEDLAFFSQKLMKNDDEMRSVYSCGIDPKFHHSFVVTFLHLQRMFRRVEKSFTAGNFMADHGWCAEPLAAVDGVLNPLLQAWA